MRSDDKILKEHQPSNQTEYIPAKCSCRPAGVWCSTRPRRLAAIDINSGKIGGKTN